MLPALLASLQVARVGPRQPRTADALLGGQAYSSPATRTALRARGITAVIAEPADQAGHRERRGSRGGRPPAFDPVRYEDRNVVEDASYQAINDGEPSPPATTSSPSPIAPLLIRADHVCGCGVADAPSASAGGRRRGHVFCDALPGHSPTG